MNLDEFLYKNSSLFEGEINEIEIMGVLKDLSEDEFNELLADLAKSYREEFNDIILSEILDFAYDDNNS
jgi:hypothetical protein